MEKKPHAKIILNCENCSYENSLEIEMSLIFNALQIKYPSTKGPIDSIKVILEKKQKRKILTEANY